MNEQTWFTDEEGITYDSTGNVLLNRYVHVPENSLTRRIDYGNNHKFRLRDFDFRDCRGYKNYLERNGWDGKPSEANMKCRARAFTLGIYSQVAPVFTGCIAGIGILSGVREIALSFLQR